MNGTDSDFFERLMELNINADDIDSISYLAIETHSAWLSTTASQIFFMQLGFLCFEVGFVEPEYAGSIILKNLEDVFSAFMGYVLIGYTLSGVESALNPLIGNFKFTSLLTISKEEYDVIFVNACFAATAATIISGAVLERMRNSAYMIYVFLTTSVNYAFIAYWVWNPKGWLFDLGFQDSAGCGAVHMLGGLGSLIPLIYLGPRYKSITKNENGDRILKPVEEPYNMILMMIGCLILWYGWVAFNTVSPVAGGGGMGATLGSTALLTVMAPVASIGSVIFLGMIFPKKVKIDGMNLMTAILGGLVAITCSNHIVSLGATIIIGALAPIVALFSGYILRDKLFIDDPLGVLPVHLVCAMYGLIMEGLFSEVNGLFTKGEFKHFGVQVLGVIVIFIFCVLSYLFYWEILLKRIFFRKSDIKITPLQLFLRNGIKLNDVEPWFSEIIKNDTKFSKIMLQKFHVFLMLEIYCGEQLDFIIAVSYFNKLFKEYNHISKPVPIPVKPTPSNSPRETEDIPVELQDNLNSLATPATEKKTKAKGMFTRLSAGSSPKGTNGLHPMKVINGSHDDKIITAFKSLCELYIHIGSNKEINISHKLRQTILKYQKSDRLIVVTKTSEQEYSMSSQTGDSTVDEVKSMDFEQEYYIHANIFNAAFLVVYKDILHNFRLFLDKISANYNEEIESNKENDTDRDTDVFHLNDIYDVQWIIDKKLLNKRKSVAKQKRIASIKRHKNKYILNSKGELKTADEIISEIQTGVM